MPDADTVTPLCTADQFNEGPYQDLASQYTTEALNDIMIEATRACEDEVHRRLAPFTGLQETHRADSTDADEYADAAGLPMPIQGTLGWSFATSIGATNLVRHMWVEQYPGSKYADLWAYSDVTVEVILSYGGTPQTLSAAQILDGPDDQGHIWFQLGQFIPLGSRLRVTYSGGYQTVPAGLVRACRFMAAYFCVRDLDPDATTQHDPDQLHADALIRLAPFVQDD